MAKGPHQHIQRAGREFAAVVRADTRPHEHFRNRLLAILWVTVAVIVLGTLVVFVVEHHRGNPDLDSLYDSFLFTSSQILTASSVAIPATGGIRLLEVFFDIYALTVVAALAGSFGSFFHARSLALNEAADAKAASEAAGAGAGGEGASAAT